MPRRYTKHEKTAAVLEAENTTVEAAAEKLGIPRTTIDYWMDKPEFVELRSKSQEERADQFRVLAQLAVDRLVKLVPSMKPHDLIILAGVATEKGQLLGGHATARTENVSITDGLDDHEKSALRDAIVGELARRADEGASVPAVGAAEAEGTDPPTG